MLAELQGKGGQVCVSAKEGHIRCPLIVRPTSEDVITGEVFRTLRTINPRWWLPQLLNTGLRTNRFRQQVFRKLRLELWKNQPKYPSEFLPWSEGSTQVDVTISWENPPTTIFVECKFLSDLAARTSGNNGSHGFPADQLIRNIRVGLWRTGWLRPPNYFFPPSTREFAVLVFSPSTGQPLVASYRNSQQLTMAIPHASQLLSIPAYPFVGEAGYEDLLGILRRNARHLSVAERRLVEDLTTYLRHKSTMAIADRVQRTSAATAKLPGIGDVSHDAAAFPTTAASKS